MQNVGEMADNKGKNFCFSFVLCLFIRNFASKASKKLKIES